VGWQFRDRRPVMGWPDGRRYVLTLWSPERITPGSARWVPHTLVRASPFPFSGRSVRLADVTRDGHADLLVTVLCRDCNHAVTAVGSDCTHAAAAARVYASIGGRTRRIYGAGTLGVAKGSGPNAVVRGRVITETAWGALRGLVWFDEPRGGTSVCCPAFRLQT